MRPKSELDKLFKLLHLVFLGLLIVFGGCGKDSGEPWRAQEISNLILIGTENCNPPCWQPELEFRITSFDEAWIQLQNYQAKNPSSRLLRNDQNDSLTWVNSSTEIVLRFENGKLFFITFGSSTADLGSIVAHFGWPEKYYIAEDPRGYVIDIFYPNHGIIFSSVNDFSPVSETMIVDKFTFYDPEYNLDSFLDQYYGYDLDQVYEGLFQWQGFGVCPEGLEFPETCVSD